MFGDVRRGKALALVLDKVKITDTTGAVLTLDELRGADDDEDEHDRSQPLTRGRGGPCALSEHGSTAALNRRCVPASVGRTGAEAPASGPPTRAGQRPAKRTRNTANQRDTTKGCHDRSAFSRTAAPGRPARPATLDDSVYNRLLKERIIFLGSEVTDQVANRICAQLLLLAAEDAERDI